MPKPIPLHATVVAATVDGETRTLVFHLQARQESGELVEVDFPLSIPDPTSQEGVAPEEDGCGCPGCGCLPGDGRTPGCTHPEGCGWAGATPDVEGTQGPLSLAGALRRLAHYLEPILVPEETRRELFLPEEVAPSYGAAGRERVLERISERMEDQIPGILLAIMGGQSPEEALGERGLLDHG